MSLFDHLDYERKIFILSKRAYQDLCSEKSRILEMQLLPCQVNQTIPSDTNFSHAIKSSLLY